MFVWYLRISYPNFLYTSFQRAPWSLFRRMYSSATIYAAVGADSINSNDGTKHQFRPHDRIVIEWHASRSADERLRGPQANESSRSFLAADAARQLAVIESSFFGRETLVCACVFP